MHIITKEGKVIEGVPLTEDQLLAHTKLPDIIKDCSTVYVATADRHRLALYLVERLEIKVRPPEPVVEATEVELSPVAPLTLSEEEPNF